MKIRKRWVILAVVVLSVGAFLTWYWRHTTTPEYQARQLVAEVRESYTGAGSDYIKQWLFKIGLMSEERRRFPDEIEKDLIALGAAAVPALIEALKDDNAGVREWAALTLTMVAPASEETVLALIEAMKDENCEVRSTAAFALTLVGPAARPAIPALAEALKDENFFRGEYVFERRFSLAVALVEFGRSGEPYLIEALDDEESDVRFAVIRALGWSETASDEVIASLARCLKDENERVRELAAIVLTEFAPEAQVAETVPLLIRALETESGFAVEAADALGRIGPPAKAAIPALTESLKDKEVYEAAFEALKKIEGSSSR